MKAYNRRTTRSEVEEGLSEVFEVVRCSASGMSYLDFVGKSDKPVRVIPASLESYEWPDLPLYYVQWSKKGPMYLGYLWTDNDCPGRGAPLDYVVVDGKYHSIVPKRIRMINRMKYCPTGYRYNMR